MATISHPLRRFRYDLTTELGFQDISCIFTELDWPGLGNLSHELRPPSLSCRLHLMRLATIRGPLTSRAGLGIVSVVLHGDIAIFSLGAGRIPLHGTFAQVGLVSVHLWPFFHFSSLLTRLFDPRVQLGRGEFISLLCHERWHAIYARAGETVVLPPGVVIMVIALTPAVLGKPSWCTRSRHETFAHSYRARVSYPRLGFATREGS